MTAGQLNNAFDVAKKDDLEKVFTDGTVTKCKNMYSGYKKME